MSEWISVKDKLPEVIGEEMLVVGSSGLGPEPYITLVEYLGNGHWGTTRDDELNGFNSRTITHWMPLPLPPPEAHAHAARDWEESEAIVREAQNRKGPLGP